MLGLFLYLHPVNLAGFGMNFATTKYISSYTTLTWVYHLFDKFLAYDPIKTEVALDFNYVGYANIHLGRTCLL